MPVAVGTAHPRALPRRGRRTAMGWLLRGRVRSGFRYRRMRSARPVAVVVCATLRVPEHLPRLLDLLKVFRRTACVGVARSLHAAIGALQLVGIDRFRHTQHAIVITRAHRRPDVICSTSAADRGEPSRTKPPMMPMMPMMPIPSSRCGTSGTHAPDDRVPRSGPALGSQLERRIARPCVVRSYSLFPHYPYAQSSGVRPTGVIGGGAYAACSLRICSSVVPKNSADLSYFSVSRVRASSDSPA